MRTRHFWPLLFLVSLPAQAGIVSVVATGTVTTVTDTDGLLPWSGLVPGESSASMWFSYDDAIPPLTARQDVAVYEALPFFMAIEGVTVSNAVGQLTILDDFFESGPGSYYDTWQGAAAARERNPPLPDRMRSLEFLLKSVASSPPVDALTSTDLLPPEWPGNWQTGTILYRVLVAMPGQNTFSTLAEVRAGITTVVVTPAPSALLLLVTALGSAIAAARAR